MSENIFRSSFSQFLFSELNLSLSLEATTRNPMVLVYVPSSTSPLTSYIISNPLPPYNTIIYLPSYLPQINTPSISTIPSLQIHTPIPHFFLISCTYFPHLSHYYYSHPCGNPSFPISTQSPGHSPIKNQFNF